MRTSRSAARRADAIRTTIRTARRDADNSCRGRERLGLGPLGDLARRRLGALGGEELAHPLHDLGAVLVLARPDGLAERERDAVAAAERPELRPAQPLRHDRAGAVDVD